MELLRESKVYIQTTNLVGVVSTFRLHVQNIEFNQAFKQESYKTKTLQEQSSWYEGSSITTANNANFSISIHMVDESSTHQHKLIELLLETDTKTLKTFTLFIDPQKEDKIYKIESCIITSGSFNLPRGGIMTADFEGQGTKLSRINADSVTLTDSSYDTDPTFAVAKRVDVTINSKALENVLGVTLEIQNDVEWIKSKTLQSSLSVSSATNSIYPANFVLSKRTVAGNITQYVNKRVTQPLQAYYDQSDDNIQTWKENIPIHIKAGLASNNYQLNAQLTPCSYTNRVNPSEVFTQSYDFRLLRQVTPLNTLIQHT